MMSKTIAAPCLLAVGLFVGPPGQGAAEAWPERTAKRMQTAGAALKPSSFVLGLAQSEEAAPPPRYPPDVTPSIANPAIGVIGWFQAVAGNDSDAQEDPFELREAELSFQAPVDPFTRADVFVAFGREEVELEEATITWLALPGGGQAKAGKFRGDLGKFNRTHPPETPFADRPLSTVAFLGEEGLSTVGVAGSILVPNPADVYWDVIGNVGTVPEGDPHPLFQADSRSDVLTLARSSVFLPVGESGDVNLGGSYANARARDTLRADGSRAQIFAGDITVRWKNPRRSIYRSFLAQAEVMVQQGSRSGASSYTGWFGYAMYQLARQWKIGARYDWTESPGDPARTRGVLALIQFQPSEFSTLSLQVRRVRPPGGTNQDSAFFKWTFNIGPHGSHPY